MSGGVPPTPFQRVSGGQQAGERCSAQGAEPAGRAPLGHEVGRLPAARLRRPNPAGGAAAPDVGALHPLPPGDRAQRPGGGRREPDHGGRAVPGRIHRRAVAGRVRHQLRAVQTAVFSSWRRRAGLGLPGHHAAGRGVQIEEIIPDQLP